MNFSCGSVGNEFVFKALHVGDAGSVPGSGRSSGEGNGYPLQYSCLENPEDGGAWWATVHGVAKSRDGDTATVGAHSPPLCPDHFPQETKALPSALPGQAGTSLRQGIFPTQGSNPQLLHLLRWQLDSDRKSVV